MVRKMMQQCERKRRLDAVLSSNSGRERLGTVKFRQTKPSNMLGSLKQDFWCL